MNEAGRNINGIEHMTGVGMAQREIRARSIHGAQDPHLGGSVRQTRSGEAKPGGSEQGQRQPEERRQLLDASPQLHDLVSEIQVREVRHIQTDHNGWRRAQPATCR